METQAVALNKTFENPRIIFRKVREIDYSILIVPVDGLDVSDVPPEPLFVLVDCDPVSGKIS